MVLSGKSNDFVVILIGKKDLICQSIKKIKTLKFELKPQKLYDLGFERALEWFFEHINDHYGN